MNRGADPHKQHEAVFNENRKFLQKSSDKLAREEYGITHPEGFKGLRGTRVFSGLKIMVSTGTPNQIFHK